MPKLPEGPGELGLKFVAEMDRFTLDKIGPMGLANAERNASQLSHGKSIVELRGAPLGEGDSAVIIAAGPSIARRDPLKVVKTHGYKGALIVTDSAMYYCLRNGIVPDLVVTVDPHAKRMIRWFGVPDLSNIDLAEDDYFRRQDLDESFAREIEVNNEILSLLDRYGPQIRIALASCTAPEVVERVLATGMQIYWWNPMFDDPEIPNSNTNKLFLSNKLPCINAGGNVGSACYMMAHAVLSKRIVAVTGMDFSYYSETAYRSTQYYTDLLDIVGEDNLDAVFIRVFNPYLKEWFYTDPAYYWFRQVFLELAADADCRTVNCTEGGILFGENVEFMPLSDFLETVMAKS